MIYTQADGITVDFDDGGRTKAFFAFSEGWTRPLVEIALTRITAGMEAQTQEKLEAEYEHGFQDGSENAADRV